MAAADDAFEKGRALPEDERCRLITRLMETMEDERGGEGISSDAEWQAAWNETIQRRLRSIDDGTAEMLDGDEVLAEMHALAAAPARK